MYAASTFEGPSVVAAQTAAHTKPNVHGMVAKLTSGTKHPPRCVCGCGPTGLSLLEAAAERQRRRSRSSASQPVAAGNEEQDEAAPECEAAAAPEAAAPSTAAAVAAAAAAP